MSKHVTWAAYCKMMQDLALGIPTQQSELDLPQAEDIRINDLAPVMRASRNDIELAQMRFGFPPSNPRGGPVFNFRSEGRRFDKSNRCLVPASAFFEFTGKKYPKAKHRFALTDAPPFMAIAGLWREGQGNQPPSFTMLTTVPGPDVTRLAGGARPIEFVAPGTPYHDRQAAVLQPRDWTAWMGLTVPEAQLLKPLPAGSLTVETVRPASD